MHHLRLSALSRWEAATFLGVRTNLGHLTVDHPKFTCLQHESCLPAISLIKKKLGDVIIKHPPKVASGFCGVGGSIDVGGTRQTAFGSWANRGRWN
jgi:hypothetical protein